MFAYCGNNPVSRADDSGEFWNIVIGAAVGAVVSGLVSFVSQLLDNGIENVDWARVGVSAAAGAVSGGLAATGIPVAGQIIANGIIGAVSSGADTYFASEGKASIEDYVSSVAIGAGLGMVGGFIGGNGTGTGHLTKSAEQVLKRTGNAIANIGKSGLGNAAKEIVKAGKYYSSQVTTLAIRAGKQAIAPIIASNIPNAIYNIGGAFV